MSEYVPHYLGQSHNLKTPQLRTIPISRSLSAEQAIMPYEEARRIITEQKRIIVAPCICRKEHKIMGKGCDKLMEACLVFGVGAQYYEENGLGRIIEQDEALNILDRAETQGLVLQPSNTQKVVNICICCGCCCQILKNLKRLPAPARYAASNYFAVHDPELCTGCGTCEQRCQMDAIELTGGTAAIKRDHCIGCGLCIPTCPEGALSLERKPEEELQVPPADRMDAFKRIAEDRIARLQASREQERE